MILRVINLLRDQIGNHKYLKKVVNSMLDQLGARRFLLQRLVKFASKSTSAISQSQTNYFFSYLSDSRTRTPLVILDISVLTRANAGGGIQRVQIEVTRATANITFNHIEVRPVYFDGSKYRFLNLAVQNFDHLLKTSSFDAPVELQSGDSYLSLDLDYLFVITHQNLYSELRAKGIYIFQVVYDLLPIRFPTYFNDGIAELHEAWLRVITTFDGIFCISNSVAKELTDWITSNGMHFIPVRSFVLGQNATRKSLKEGYEVPFFGFKPDHVNYLMVGTLEPRKGYKETLETFIKIWESGRRVTLTIVGKPGWKTESLIQALTTNKEYGKRLHLKTDANDQVLSELYEHAHALIAASYGEGYGLPLVESKDHGLPVIARDIPIFREVLGDDGIYFDSTKPNALYELLMSTTLSTLTKTKFSQSNVQTTWEDSCRDLLNQLIHIKGSN
jgi:glycosyltransferase involved in cell wall biosynthesis